MEARLLEVEAAAKEESEARLSDVEHGLLEQLEAGFMHQPAHTESKSLDGRTEAVDSRALGRSSGEIPIETSIKAETFPMANARVGRPRPPKTKGAPTQIMVAAVRHEEEKTDDGDGAGKLAGDPAAADSDSDTPESPRNSKCGRCGLMALFGCSRRSHQVAPKRIPGR
eukprot:FR736776.1.p1 GENE.FR736776.1~~FR736776.1.p1  ORF type:complete len:176 (+),score=21.42 FR736776.1:23-529(+)